MVKPTWRDVQFVAIGEKEIVQRANGIRAARSETNRQYRLAKLAAIAAGNGKLPTHRQYPVILADVPWSYEHHSSHRGGVENHYPVLSLDQICNLPITKLATKDALLLLWATCPKLAEAMRVIECWGFTYRTGLVWVKTGIGTGLWVRGAFEHLLLATRGNFPIPSPADRPRNVLVVPRQKHSQKPVEVYELIEKMTGNLPRIELFGRSRRKGWEVFGNQVGI